MSKKTKTNKPLVNQQSHKVEAVSVQTAYSGPIPPARELEAYDAVVPGAAKKILRMAEKNLQHQIDIETLALDSARKEARRGQIFAFLIAFSSSIAAMIMGFPFVAIVISGTTLVSLTIAFSKGRHNNST